MVAMTEAEAKGKWCPFARVSWHVAASPAFPSQDGYAGNRDANNGHVPGSECAASACMAWRWAPGGEWRQIDDAGLNWTRDRSTALGYCGLAGKVA